MTTQHEHTSSLDASERAACAALARWLGTDGIVGACGLFAAAVAALCLLLDHTALGHRIGFVRIDTGTLIAAGVALLLMPIERAYALRLRFDRGLFTDLAAGRIESLAALDVALAMLGLRGPAAATRPLADRIRGAQRLWHGHAAVAAAQVLLCLLAVALRL